jgi:alpha-N-arabinofuranosidase
MKRIVIAVGGAFALLLAACTTVPQPEAADRAGTASFDWFDYRGEDPVSGPAPRAGEYRNPILSGFYPDPSITRVGNDFYLVNSTFSYFPGIPVFHSRDLVSWTQIGNAIDRPTQLDFGRLGMSRGVFAPTIEHHRGTFYILNTCVDCGGNFLITASNPAGPWSDPVWLRELNGGIDPSLYFDEGGRAWIVNNGPPVGTPLYEGHRAIWIQQYDPAAKRMIGPRSVLVNGGVDMSKKPAWIEGPHIFRKDGFYYLSAAEGGTAEGHSQVVLRSDRVTGPYLPNPANPILTQRDLPRDRPLPITSAGHADFVETAAGEWWATFLAVRPYAGDDYNTGRETFLMPVKWHDGWPRITAPAEAIPYTHSRPKLPAQPAPPVPTSGAFTVRDEFNGRSLPPYWLMMRNPREKWYDLSGGALHLQPRPVGLGDMGNPSFLGRRQQHMNASATTLIRYRPIADGSEAGMAAIQNDDFWYFLGIVRDNGRLMVSLKRRSGPNTPVAGETLASAPLELPAGAPLLLRIEARGGHYDFSYATRENEWRLLRGGEDGTILSTRTAGGFVGALFGLHARSATQAMDR